MASLKVKMIVEYPKKSLRLPHQNLKSGEIIIDNLQILINLGINILCQALAGSV
jgi:hypothetical protein